MWLTEGFVYQAIADARCYASKRNWRVRSRMSGCPVFRDFSRQYHSAGFDKPKLTTGDAFIEFVRHTAFHGEPYEKIGRNVETARRRRHRGQSAEAESADMAKDIAKVSGLRLISRISPQGEGSIRLQIAI